MKERIGFYPRARVEGGGRSMVSQAGAVLLAETVRIVGLDQAISAALAPRRKPRDVRDPVKILLDLALAVALGGNCLADIAVLRAEPAVFGPVASDPTVSRLIDTLAASGEKALGVVQRARSEARSRVWSLADGRAPDAGGEVTIDLDGVLVVAHSDKQDAARSGKKTYGHHPLMGFVDHGPGGTGEPVATLLRTGNVGSNTAADHITAVCLASAQLPKKYRRGRQTLIRTDSGGGTHEFVSWLARRGRWLSCSVDMVITDTIHVWHSKCHTPVMAHDDTDFPPGDGPSSGISVSLTAGTLQAIRERVGKRGVSAYLEKAAQRQIERDNLNELIADFEQANGPADPEAVAAKRAKLTGRPSSGTGAAA